MKYTFSIIFIATAILLTIVLFNYFSPLFISPIERFHSLDEKRFNYFHIRCINEVNEFLVMKDDAICCEITNLYIDSDNVLDFNVSLMLKGENKIVEEKQATLYEKSCFDIEFVGSGGIYAEANFTLDRNDEFGYERAKYYGELLNFRSYSTSEIESNNRNTLLTILSFTILVIAVFSGIGSLFNIILKEREIQKR